jgi:hypothetical protein
MGEAGGGEGVAGGRDLTALVARMSEAISGTSRRGRSPDVAEPVIGRAFAPPVGLFGLRNDGNGPRMAGASKFTSPKARNRVILSKPLVMAPSLDF